MRTEYHLQLKGSEDKRAVQSAWDLRDGAPRPKRVRLSGRLDMIRASTFDFGLKLADGQEVRGLLRDGGAEALQVHFQKDVVVLGLALFRPSGRLLRVEADQILEATAADGHFSAMPVPARSRPDLREAIRGGAGLEKGGVAAIIGRWPGDESDEEIERALREAS